MSRVKSESNLQEVIDKTGISFTTSELSSHISVKSENDSDMLYIYVHDKDKERTYVIGDALTNIFIENYNKMFNSSLFVYNVGVPYILENVNLITYLKNILIFGVVGLFLGLGVVFVLFYFDDSITSPSFINEELGIKIFGVVPKDKKSSYYSSAFKNIRSNIQICNSLDKKIITISSIDYCDNKLALCKEIAKEYSKIGKKCLVLSCDIKESNNEVGYTDYILDDNIELNKIIIKREVDFLLSGTKKNLCIEAISSSKNNILLKKLLDNYDVIIISAPPVIGSNGTNLVTKDDFVNLVIVNSDETKKSELIKANKLFKDNGVLIDGIVINSYVKNYNYGREYLESYYK